MELLFIIPYSHNDMILKKYKIMRNGHVRTRVIYRRTGVYCIGCIHFTGDSHVCSLKDEIMAKGLPKICSKDMKRWRKGPSNFVYHILGIDIEYAYYPPRDDTEEK